MCAAVHTCISHNIENSVHRNIGKNCREVYIQACEAIVISI